MTIQELIDLTTTKRDALPEMVGGWSPRISDGRGPIGRIYNPARAKLDAAIATVTEEGCGIGLGRFTCSMLRMVDCATGCSGPGRVAIDHSRDKYPDEYLEVDLRHMVEALGRLSGLRQSQIIGKDYWQCGLVNEQAMHIGQGLTRNDAIIDALAKAIGKVGDDNS